MKTSRIFLFLFFMALVIPTFAKKTNDTLLLKLFNNAEKYDKVVRHYESDIYIKGTVHLKGKNRFMNRVPQTRTFASGVKDYFGESYGSLSYTAPFTFDRDVEVVSGTFPVMKEESDMVLDFFNLTIYRESLIEDRLLSPFHLKNIGFYKYTLDSIQGERYYYTFKPKYSNTQLVKGNFVVNARRIIVEEARLIGKFDFMKFDLLVTMGTAGFMAYLPNRYVFKYHFGFFGNKLDGEYKTVQNYQKVEVVYEPVVKAQKSKYDLSDRYAHTVDTAKVIVDSSLIAKHRFIPLSTVEQDMYKRWTARLDSISKAPKVHKSKSLGDIAEDFLFSHSYINLGKKLGKVRMNPLLDISLISYSSTKGYSYSQNFKYVYSFKDQREFILRPRIGYNIKYKQFYWRVISRYNYLPYRQGAFEFEVGNGNRITGSIKQESGSMYSNKFSDNYMKFKHEIEVTNGLMLTVGATYHRRQPWKISAESAEELGIRQYYRSFSPSARLEWTPGQYYYRKGRKKVDVYSRFPTFAVDWERGIKGVIGSTSSYERVEGDISYEWDKDTMHKFSWRLGAGKFIQKEVLEFIDYHSFRKHYLPESWEDELGGRFTLLNSHWFNESMWYARGHLIYESPMLLLGHLGSHGIQRERLYGNVLKGDFVSGSGEKFKNYFEVGYGFATRYFDLGFYASFMDGKYEEWGIKYNFTLFH